LVNLVAEMGTFSPFSATRKPKWSWSGGI
jgi:hypothetical protein